MSISSANAPRIADPVLESTGNFTVAWYRFLQSISSQGGDVATLQAEIDALAAALGLTDAQVAALQAAVATLGIEVAALAAERAQVGVDPYDFQALERRLGAVSNLLAATLAQMPPPPRDPSYWDTGYGGAPWDVGGLILWSVAP